MQPMLRHFYVIHFIRSGSHSVSKKMTLYRRYRTAVALALAFSPVAGCVAPPLYVYIQIYFQAGKLQMKWKFATGNRN